MNAQSEGLTRNSGTFLSMTSNWTVCIWAKRTVALTGTQYGTFYQLYQAGVPYIFLGPVQPNQTIQLWVDNGSSTQNITSSTSLTTGTWYFFAITYDSTSKVFTLYQGTTPSNLASLGTITLDFSAVTFDRQAAGWDGTVSDTSNNAVEYFRDWQRKLTLTELQAEMAAYTAVLATNLFTDTPIQVTGTLTDLSGNGHTWTANGAISFTSPGPLPPANANGFASAIDISTLLPYAPASFNAIDADIIDGIWYKYTGQAGDNVIGFWAFGALGGYSPTVRVFNSDGVTQYDGYHGGASPNKPLQIAMPPGTTRYFSVRSAGNVQPATLAINVLRASNAIVPAGSIGVNDDTELLPIALLSSSTGLPLNFIINNPTAGEAAAILTNGILALSADNEGAPVNPIRIYDNQYNILATIAANATGLTCNMSNKFYYTKNTTTVQTFFADGTLGNSFVIADSSIKALAVRQDDTIFYYHAVMHGPIKRFDIINNIAMSDFAAGVPNYAVQDQSLHALSDGKIVAGYRGGGSGKDLFVRVFDSSGTILNTFNFGDVGQDVRMAMAIDDPNSIWLWTKNLTAGVVDGFDRFRNIRISDGVILTDINNITEYEAGYFRPAATASPVRFGHSESCPFFITRVALNPLSGTYSGVYKLTPGLTHDTIYTSITPGNPPTTVTGNFKIP